MNCSPRIYHLVVVALLVGLLAGGCDNQGASRSVTVSYSPPLLPIEITYDVTTSQLRVAVSGRIQTPIGAFKVSYGATSIGKRYNGVRTLTIITGTRKYVYELEHGRPYSIRLPSDENGQTEVRYSGTDENLEISIPNPTDETIAGLKQKLREEQEARERAEGTATNPGSEPSQTASPTPLAQRTLTSQECQELVSQYSPEKFLYVPPECQDMLRAYQSYLQQQEYEARRRREQEEYETRRRQEQENHEDERRAEAKRRKDEEAARKRLTEIERWSNIIEGIVRRRRR